jgi:hypothetical protein
MPKPSTLSIRKLPLVRSLLIVWSMDGRLLTNLHQTSKILGCPWRKLEITSNNLSKGSANEEDLAITLARDHQLNLPNLEQQFLLHCPPHNIHNPGMTPHIHREHRHLMDSQPIRSSTSENVVKNSLTIKWHHHVIQKTFRMISHELFFEPNLTSFNPLQASKSPLFLSLTLSNSSVILLLRHLPFQPLCCQQRLTYPHCPTEYLLTRISNPHGNCARPSLPTKLLSLSLTLCNSNPLLIQSPTPCGGKSFKTFMLI